MTGINKSPTATPLKIDRSRSKCRAQLCAEIVLLPVWAAAISTIYNATSGYVGDNVVELGNIENMGIAVRILLLHALELEI